MAEQQATPEQMNRFVAEVDKFMRNYATLLSPATAAQVYGTGDQALINEYVTVKNDGAAIKASVDNLVGAWAKFKQAYGAVTDVTSTAIGDAIDWLRGILGGGPAADLSAYRYADVSPISGGRFGQWRGGGTLEPGVGQWRGGGTLEPGMGQIRYADVSPISGGTLGALSALPIILGATAVAAIIAGAYLWNQRAERIFISLEADKIQTADPTKSRGEAIDEAAGAIRQPLLGDLGAPLMIAAIALAAWFLLGRK